MANKYHHVKPKVHPLTTSIIIGAIVLIVGLIFILQPSDQQQIYSAYEAYATNDFTEDHPFVSINYGSSLFSKGLDKVIAEEELVLVYIGSPSCTSCQAHIGSFQKYYEELGFDQYVDQIYYFAPENDSDGFYDMIADFETVTETTPQFIMFQNGEIILQFEVLSGDDEQIINRSVRDFYEEVIDLLNA